MGFFRNFVCTCTAAAIIPLASFVVVILEKPYIIDGIELSSALSAVEHERSKSSGDQTTPVDSVTEDAMGTGKMFDRIASAYDQVNSYMSLGLDKTWREHLVRECMDPQQGERILDLATGTADVGLAVAERLQGGTLAQDSVMGIDPSREMLCVGKGKVQSRGFEGAIRLAQGDAQDLSKMQTLDQECAVADASKIETASINKISMSFGIRNVPDRAKAFREMKRVLKDHESSRVCILEFSLPAGDTFLSRVAREFINHVVPFVGRMATLGQAEDEYRYLQESILKFPGKFHFATSMAEQGLAVTKITSFAYGAVQLYTAQPKLVAT